MSDLFVRRLWDRIASHPEDHAAQQRLAAENAGDVVNNGLPLMKPFTIYVKIVLSPAMFEGGVSEETAYAYVADVAKAAALHVVAETRELAKREGIPFAQAVRKLTQ